MADTKISALPASTTPLAGTETLPIVQGGVTKKVSVADLTAGRAPSVSGLTVSGLTASTALALNASKELVSVTNTGTGDNVLATSPTLVGNVTLSTGNLVVSDTKGIDFSATPGTGTSELLDDYEEGTWTANIVCSGGTITLDNDYKTGSYVKVGNIVTLNGAFVVSSVSSPSGNMYFETPFNALNSLIAPAGGGAYLNGVAAYADGSFIYEKQAGNNRHYIFRLQDSGSATGAAPLIQANTVILIDVSYRTE